MKKILLIALSCFFLTGLSAQTDTNYKEKHPYKDWVKIAPKFDDAFFKTPEAIRIADNVLLYQQITGGWPKNIYMAAELTDQERKDALKMKENVNLSTIDNRATITEMNYLARIYLATQDEKYKDAFLRGLQYLFEAQYENGGWPQFYPRPKGYYIHITYNDEAFERYNQSESSLYFRSRCGTATSTGSFGQRSGMHFENPSKTKWQTHRMVCTARPRNTCSCQSTRLRTSFAKRTRIRRYRTLPYVLI